MALVPDEPSSQEVDEEQEQEEETLEPGQAAGRQDKRMSFLWISAMGVLVNLKQGPLEGI